MNSRTFWCLQILVVAIIAGVAATPHVVHFRETHGQGLIRMVTTDDGFYAAHVKAALLGRTAEVSNGVTGGQAQGASPALLESVAGFAFSWSSLKAPELLALLSVLFMPLFFFALVHLLMKVAKSRTETLAWAAVYVFVFIGALLKPVHLSLNLPVTVTTLLLIRLLWQRPKRQLACIVGVLLGIFPWVYFWSWTYLWSVFGVLFVLHLWLVPASQQKTLRTRMLLLTIAVLCVTAVPFFLHLLASRSDPVFLQTALRSTLIHSRGVESVPRFALLTFLVGAMALLTFRSSRERELLLFPVACITGVYLAMYQNFLHGVILSFSSHYYAFVCLSAVIVAAAVRRVQDNVLLRSVIILPVCLLLLAGAWDYRDNLPIVLGRYFVRDIDHLRPAVTLLDDGVRETVLTDSVSAHAITSYTDDDTIFTAYLKHLLISDQEYAERYCLSELFNPAGPDLEWLAVEVEELRIPENLTKREEQFAAVCASIKKDPRAFLKKYNVSKLLWNETLRPDWKIDTRLLSRTASGSGWSIWKVISF